MLFHFPTLVVEEDQSTWMRCAVKEMRILSLIALILLHMTAITQKTLELDVKV
jgi:hypothetical protein